VAEADPSEPILIIVRKPNKPNQDMEKEIRIAVEQRFARKDRPPPPYHFLTWGRHLAVNDYANFKHVIVVGLLRYTASQAEAMARASGGLAPDEQLSETSVDRFHRSEIAHHLFQGVGRGAVRKAVGGDVPDGCRLDIVFGTKGNGASVSVDQAVLRMAFPEARVVDWHPLPVKLSANEIALVEELQKSAKGPSGIQVALKDLAASVGIAPNNIWLALKRPHVEAELAHRGIVLDRRKGRPMLVSLITAHHSARAVHRRRTRHSRKQLTLDNASGSKTPNAKSRALG
jgi:hypothetical protein